MRIPQGGSLVGKAGRTKLWLVPAARGSYVLRLFGPGCPPLYSVFMALGKLMLNPAPPPSGIHDPSLGGECISYSVLFSCFFTPTEALLQKPICSPTAPTPATDLPPSCSPANPFRRQLPSPDWLMIDYSALHTC